jgi:hypothetical protein
MIRRTNTLVVFNTWAGAITSDGKPSEQCADAYALARGYTTTNGKYWKIGVDFGCKSLVGQWSSIPGALRSLMCTKSFAPGQTPEVDNPRYTGKTMADAIANMVNDGQLDAIFIESLVPNQPTQTGNQAPDGWFIAMCPYLSINKTASGGSRFSRVTDIFVEPAQTVATPDLNKWVNNNRDAQLPYGRIGWPGCTFADIQRVAADANWGESQNNLGKLHVVGGTNYTQGGDIWHMNRAGASFAKFIKPENLGVFDQAAKYAGVPQPTYGTIFDWDKFNWGALVTPLSLFGLLFSINPEMAADWSRPLNAQSWAPQRGAWAYNWCSNAAYVAYDCLKRGGVASILCENEPNASGIPAVDCVAYALTLGLTMAEACFLSDQMTVSNASVYGAPDYAPYMATNGLAGLITPPVVGVPPVVPPAPVERRVGPADRRPKRTDRRNGVADRRKSK